MLICKQVSIKVFCKMQSCTLQNYHHYVAHSHLETPHRSHWTARTLLRQHLPQPAARKIAAAHMTYHHNCIETE